MNRKKLAKDVQVTFEQIFDHYRRFDSYFGLDSERRLPGKTLYFRRQHMSLNLDVSFNYGARIQTTVDFLRHGSVSNGVNWESFE